MQEKNKKYKGIMETAFVIGMQILVVGCQKVCKLETDIKRKKEME